jgi:hypothetical protein
MINVISLYFFRGIVLFLVWVINARSVIAKGLITGTAVFINDNGDMLTNRHVIENCGRLMVKPNDDGSLFNTKITSISKIFDMALIKEDGFHPSPSQISWIRVNRERHVGIARPGDAVLYGGYDQEPITNIDISNGKVIDLPISVNPDKAFVSNMISGATHGASGSGVFEDTGGLVGLVFSGYINVGEQTNSHQELDYFYGDNIINFYTTEAIVRFVQYDSPYKPPIFYRVEPPRVIRIENVGHIYATSALVVCYES